MNQRRLAFFSLIVLAVALTTVVTPAWAEVRILVVGDSWAQGICGFKAFETVFQNHGVEGVEVAGDGTTAIGGSRADQWASNHKDKLTILDQALAENPSIDIAHISIGGNDFLSASMKENVCALSKSERKAVWERVWNDIETLINHIKEQRPGIKILLNSYDYLDHTLMTARYGMVFPEGTTNQQMNDALVELAKFEMKKVKKLDDVYFIHHFGLLQYHYGFPPHFEKETVPLPGDPPSLEPFPGGKPAYTNSPEAMPDGVHPMPEGYVYIVDRCYNAYYKDWLKETAEKADEKKEKTPACCPF